MFIIDMSKLITASYWLDTRPGYDFAAWPVAVAIVVVILIVGIVGGVYLKRSKKYDKKQKRLLKGIPGTLVNFALLLGLWTFFRYENAYLLSVRLLVVLLVLGMIISVAWQIRHYRREYALYLSMKLARERRRNNKEKDYRPKPKRKAKKGIKPKKKS